jgi:chromosome segregation and condensation protein ScpB
MELKFVIESLLFTSQKPLSVREIREILTVAAEKGEEEAVKAFKKVKDAEIENVLTELEKDHAETGRSYYLACVAGAWQFVTRPDYMPWLRTLFGVKTRPPRLSAPALETLAIVAYRQPITRAEVEQIRGANHPRRSGTDPRSGGGWCGGDFAGTRVDRKRGPCGSGWSADDVCDDAVVPGIFWTTQPG